mmetsp:Transcript_5052/g.6543  ORF Transcript_5052/g.6543 Transcript_5052/m.6543 type:complete len:433 (+) Transcript_5052:146-1444(+)|eukprot:CAMPEP_0114358606 /NCGR_PEP_ID=MMETSP0101-20121206/22421_1 /TAXON_ID=38822 ORGANISM="Pteridomonas danica, Strain PT" /NCGR_SAMPLE_ID=MMETSP0101 /ASSEMBLY_ACC=CAM_ASM_000211 /LENGTH=432 /DNA_ID=CAMNT_0001501789 /DNA_START=55 /DNA_END=1353 /DNA_ORIENTATION=-
MPIELDLKRSEYSKNAATKGKEEQPEEIQNETPPYSALSHIRIDNVPFVINLCAGRHNPDQPRKQKIGRGADGKIIKPPKACKNPTCNLRTGMIDGMINKTVELKDLILEIAEQLEVVQEERGEAEQELETQKQYLRDSEARHELLKIENKECEEELERTKQEEYDCKSRVTELEAERQRLARIVFENKLKQQGIELEGWDGDGMALVPSKVFDGVPGDYDGEPKDDFIDRTHHKPPSWCTMDQLNLTERSKVNSKSIRGVLSKSAMMRPKTSPPSCPRDSGTYKAWAAQAHILPQPSIASHVDDSTIRRFERKDRVQKPKTPSFDARIRIAEFREQNKHSRHLLSDSISAYSWRSSSPLKANSSPGNPIYNNGNNRPMSVPSNWRNNGTGGHGTGGRVDTRNNSKQDVLSVITDGTAARIPPSRPRTLKAL